MADNRNELIQIGVTLRELRLSRSLTLDDIASKTGLSKSLISKIENFRTIPSLPVLASLCKALNTDMAELVQGIGVRKEEPYTLIRADYRKDINRDDGEGFRYENIFNCNIDASLFDSFVVVVGPGAKRNTVTTDGMEFIFILEGQIEFQLGDEFLSLAEGDSLFFDGRLPHVPVNKTQNDAKLLAIYLFNS